MLKTVILTDNKAADGFSSEWGYSVYAEYNGKKFLIDTGASDKYLENAEKLGIDISCVDYAVLSHAHYDHSGGYGSFFEKNKKAVLYISENCGEDCYHKFGIFRKYIGIPSGTLERYRDRIKYVGGAEKICDGVYLVAHTGKGLEKIGKKAHLYRKSNGRLLPDDFCHEQSVVFETENGLAVINSCSHSGLKNILDDIEYYLPGSHVCMTLGGLHLSKYSDSDVRKIAAEIKKLSIDKVVTGHCTGDKAYEILKEELGERVIQTCSGMTLET